MKKLTPSRKSNQRRALLSISILLSLLVLPSAAHGAPGTDAERARQLLKESDELRASAEELTLAAEEHMGSEEFEEASDALKDALRVLRLRGFMLRMGLEELDEVGPRAALRNESRDNSEFKKEVWEEIGVLRVIVNHRHLNW